MVDNPRMLQCKTSVSTRTLGRPAPPPALRGHRRRVDLRSGAPPDGCGQKARRCCPRRRARPAGLAAFDLPGSPTSPTAAANSSSKTALAAGDSPSASARRCTSTRAAPCARAGGYQRALAGRDHLDLLRDEGQLNLAVLQTFAQAGCGFDIVSGGELERVLAAGRRRRQVVFSGVGKTRAEMARALEAGVACFNVESEASWNCSRRWRAGRPQRAHQPARQPRRRPQDAPLHLHRPEGQQVRRRARTRAVAPTGAPRACRASRWGIDRHIGSQITETGPTSTRSTACSTGRSGGEPPASPCTISTSAAAWASPTPTSSRRPPRSWSSAMLARIDTQRPRPPQAPCSSPAARWSATPACWSPACCT